MLFQWVSPPGHPANKQITKLPPRGDSRPCLPLRSRGARISAFGGCNGVAQPVPIPSLSPRPHGHLGAYLESSALVGASAGRGVPAEPHSRVAPHERQRARLVAQEAEGPGRGTGVEAATRPYLPCLPTLDPQHGRCLIFFRIDFSLGSVQRHLAFGQPDLVMAFLQTDLHHFGDQNTPCLSYRALISSRF